ncbi:feruloyl esterase B [Hypoxylon fuscum]|nr:feruloyl esterase B [Hypoxylon fuscum]
MRLTSQIIFPLSIFLHLSRGASHVYLPVIVCSSLKPPAIDGAEVVSMTTQVTSSGGVEVCDINVYVTHGDAGDYVRIQTYLPLKGYNGRYQGLGGGGMMAGYFNLSGTAGAGFATGSTDAGRPNATGDDDTWADNAQLLTNFAYLSIHEMTVVGKALAKEFYGRPVQYSYWNGCSNGGRQGYQAVQRYPTDYDGVLANAPAINWDRFAVSELYPYLVEVEGNEFPSLCVWEAMTSAAVDACDHIDGGKDNVINLPFKCHFDATSTIGQTACNTTITLVHARMWNEITRGPRDHKGNNGWAGLLPGTKFDSQGGAKPFNIASAWVRAFVEQDRNFNITSIPARELYTVMNKSEVMYRHIIGGDNPDLSSFRDAGGKMLTWHGLADQLIPVYGTIHYRLRVEEMLGGNEAVNEFYRLFLAPGVDHCVGGNGAQPSDPFSLLMNWVENGTAPEMIPAKGDVGARNLCLYPKDLIYSGQGDLAQASSWICT